MAVPVYDGKSTTQLTSSGLADELLGNRASGASPGTVRIPVDAFAQQLLGSGPVQTEFSTANARIDAFAAANLAARKAYATWAALATAPGASATAAAEVLFDGGTHVDPVTGQTVANVGLYIWSTSPAGWRWQGKTTAAAKAVNLISNGALRGSGYGIKRYVPDFESGSGAPAANNYGGIFVGSSNSYFTGRGCAYALEVPPLGYGNLVSTPVRLDGGYILGIVEVASSSGDWGMGGGLSIIMRHTDGTRQTLSTGNAAWSYADVASGVRRYTVKAAVAAGKVVERIDFGFNDTSAPSRTAIFQLSGFWLSWGSTALDVADTLYPNWDAALQPAWLIDRLATMQTQIDTSGSGAGANMTSIDLLRAELRDNTRSIDMVLIGDSNTWGIGATGASAQTPRNHTLSDVRNNIDCPSWANLLRKWLGMVVASGKNRSEPAAGAGFYYEDVLVDPIRDPHFSCRNVATGAIAAPALMNDPRAGGGPILNKHIDIGIGQELRFDFVGDRFSVVHAILPNGGSYDVYVDGAMFEADVNANGSSAWSSVHPCQLSGFGLHVVSVRAKGAALRVEAIGIRRVLAVRNQGLIGTASDEWLPAGAIGLANAVPSTATDVVIMLGTNDRKASVLPKEPAKIADNLEAIVTWLATFRPTARVILMTPLLCVAGEEEGGGNAGIFFHSSEAARAVSRLAQRKGIGLVDVFGRIAHESLKGNTWTIGDNIHFNDAGHAAVFDLWVQRLIGAN